MRWLKALVIVLAALITLAIGLLGYGFIKRTEDPHWRLFSVTKTPNAPKVEEQPAAPTATATASAPAQSPLSAPSAAPWGDLQLGLAPECQIAQVQIEGNRLILNIEPTGPCRRIMIIDMEAGRVLGIVRPRP